jgi:hypothetical protein
MAILGVQLILMAAGVFFMLSKRLPLGNTSEIASPWTFFMGAVLFFHVPISFMASGAAQAIETERARKVGNQQFSAKKFDERWGWLDSSITVAAVVLGAGCGIVGIRQKPITEQPYETPVGVRDYVFESKLLEQENANARSL